VVKAFASYGITQEEICTYLKITKPTLHKHYRDEIDTARLAANANIARRLYQAAIEEGNVGAMIFWLKSRAKWSEKAETEHTGEVRIRIVRDEE
jgi:hypothetical protein